MIKEINKIVKLKYWLIVVTFLISNISYLKAQQRKNEMPLTRILFVFDASNSMYGQWQGKVKMESAKKLMVEMMDSLKQKDNLEIALRCYGHQKPYPPQDCDDTKLEVSFGSSKVKADEIKERVLKLKPSGTTPIALSLEKSGDDFPYDKTNARNIIILITDGIEECKGDPCAISLMLQKRGIILKPFVIGVGLDDAFLKTFDCVGTFYNAASEDSFREILNVVISQALNSTTAQVNLLDIYNNPSETNVNMTFYDEFSGNMRYNYVHTINSRGNPDTIQLDPIGTYNMVVHTIPPVEKKGIKLIAGKHNIIAVDAPQGYLTLKVAGNNDYRSLHYIVRKKDQMQTLVVQPMNDVEKLIVGKYDLEVLTIPRIYLPDVDVSQNKTTTIQIPQPGIVNVVMNGPGYGALYLERDNKLEWQYNFEDNATKDLIIVQPGNYRVIWRAKGGRSVFDTIERKIKVESGANVSVRLF